MKILMIGSGYVGLVSGTCLAEMGHNVICLDIDEKKIENLKKGIIPIYEPGLKEMIQRNMDQGRLTFTTDYSYGVKNAQACFLAVPSPSKEDGSCNTDYLFSAASSIAKNMDSYTVIIDKSTVPVGTAHNVKKIVQKELHACGKDCDFDVVSNPEFLKEGNAINDFMKPDRVVVGVDSARAQEIMQEIYAPFMLNHERLIIMDILSAEMTKYAANAMLATRISFMNEIAEICTRTGANINHVRKGIGSDSRIGYDFLYAGVGYGGSCFPKDVAALYNTAKSVNYTPLLIEAVEQVNNRQKKVLARYMKTYFAAKGGLNGKTIAIWGLAFKPNTDDMRKAPSLEIIPYLLEQGAFVRVFDPVAMDNAKEILNHPNITWCNDAKDAAQGANAIALITEWKQFRLIDFPSILSIMKGTGFFDGRNQYIPEEMERKGFDYFAIGVPNKALQGKQILDKLQKQYEKIPLATKK